MTPSWIALGLAAAGAVALAYAAPRARADEPPGHRSWQLWARVVGEPEWRKRGNPLGQTACKLDMADLLMKSPPGSRAACVHIQYVPVRK